MSPELIGQVFQSIVIVFGAIVLHEYAHGWTAFRLGDSTAKLAGRLTLNPFQHIDPWGTIIIPFLSYHLVGFPFGWAKPVPVDVSNLRNPRQGMLWVAVAGPTMNIAIACAFAMIFRISTLSWVDDFCLAAVNVNLILAIFNLIPVPPLDGSRIVMGILPQPLARMYAQVEPFGIVVVFILVKYGFLNFVYGVVQLLESKLIGG